MRATARPSPPGERGRRRSHGRAAQRGLTYLALLLAIALVSAVLAASATVWSQAQRREREKQLLWVGDQFKRALQAYAQTGSGNFPQRLEDLLEDPRSLAKRRFLRRIYDDPMTQGSDWALVRDVRGGIVGVHSRSTGVPLKTGRFPAEYAAFENSRSYADWRFSTLAPPPRAASGALGGTPGPRASSPAGSPIDPKPLPAARPPARETAPTAPPAEVAPIEPEAQAPAEPDPPARDD